MALTGLSGLKLMIVGAAAFTRERQIKEWKRAWKLELIEKANPDWSDLYNEL